MFIGGNSWESLYIRKSWTKWLIDKIALSSAGIKCYYSLLAEWILCMNRKPCWNNFILYNIQITLVYHLLIPYKQYIRNSYNLYSMEVFVIHLFSVETIQLKFGNKETWKPHEDNKQLKFTPGAQATRPIQTTIPALLSWVTRLNCFSRWFNL